MGGNVRERLALVRERMAQAAKRAGRSPEDVALITVTKTFDPSIIQLAVDAGVKNLGENRVQEAKGKVERVRGDGLRWHLIGHLQSNKARAAISIFDTIHTIDSASLAQRMSRIADEEGRRPEVLVQVDLAGEATKSGADEADLPDIIAALDGSSSLDFRGFMTLPPFRESPEEVRGYFSRLREIRDEVNRSRPEGRKLTELSMGMTHDFEVAIEEGATMIRVGTAIFGERSNP